MADWARHCRAPDMDVTSTGVKVQLYSGRKQHIRVQAIDGQLVLGTTVVSGNRLPAFSDEAEEDRFRMRVWHMNRGMPLIGLRFDERDRLVAESYVPTEGLTSAEFQYYLRNLAKEADRLEFIITGEDKE